MGVVNLMSFILYLYNAISLLPVLAGSIHKMKFFDTLGIVYTNMMITSLAVISCHEFSAEMH